VSEAPAVVVYVAPGCHLCDAALEVVERVRAEVAFELEIVDVTGDPELERTHREHLPVVEVDGVRAFTYFVHPTALVERLGRDT
jgi:thiol-disulfide isomerase/thioredoxin